MIDKLGLDVDLDAWWAVSDTKIDKLGLDAGLFAIWSGPRSGPPPAQRLMRLLRDVILAGTSAPVVVFFDEIDSTLNFPFRDDFFAALRACYNTRPEDPEFNRLTFVLLGVANPSDLIADPTRTPFNILMRIPLLDFTEEEARPLAEGLGGDDADRKAALGRVFYWTEGHPYLTQKLCEIATGSALCDGDGRDGPSSVSAEEAIDRIVEADFLSQGADRRDDNLRFLTNLFRGDEPLRVALRSILEKKTCEDEMLYQRLWAVGLIRGDGRGHVEFRARVYEGFFRNVL
jgi:hypothetical protein